MELEVTDSETGEVVTKSEEVYLGDFPLMTELVHSSSMVQNV